MIMVEGKDGLEKAWENNTNFSTLTFLLVLVFQTLRVVNINAVRVSASVHGGNKTNKTLNPPKKYI